MAYTVDKDKINTIRVQCQLKDWGRWKKHSGAGLGVKTPFNDREPEHVFDEEICGKVEQQWKALKDINNDWHSIIYEVYVNGSDFKSIRKALHWDNLRFKVELGKAESWIDHGVNYA